MSVYLKVLPAVLLDPDVLLELGQKICTIVRDSLILDRRMEEICASIEREGRTLRFVIERNKTSPFTADLDDAAIVCEKACSLLKAGLQTILLQNNPEHHSEALKLHHAIEEFEKSCQKQGYDNSGDRIKEIVVNLGKEEFQHYLYNLNLYSFFDDLKAAYQRFETIKMENNLIQKSEQLPTLRSTIALYGMLIDTLIANVRFENYQLLHRVESVLTQIEKVVSEAMRTTLEKQKVSKNYSSSAESVMA
jgi:hypothetical protein